MTSRTPEHIHYSSPRGPSRFIQAHIIASTVLITHAALFNIENSSRNRLQYILHSCLQTRTLPHRGRSSTISCNFCCPNRRRRKKHCSRPPTSFTPVESDSRAPRIRRVSHQNFFHNSNLPASRAATALPRVSH